MAVCIVTVAYYTPHAGPPAHKPPSEPPVPASAPM
jgi:hypothetical protein